MNDIEKAMERIEECDTTEDLRSEYQIIREALSRQQWVSVEDRVPDDSREVEIAFWDSVRMCRVFGCYETRIWWTGQEEIEGYGIHVTHWRETDDLPDPPKEKPVLINYWRCDYENYDEFWDGENELRHYGCKHPDGDGVCDLDNKYCGDKDECVLIKEKNDG